MILMGVVTAALILILVTRMGEIVLVGEAMVAIAGGVAIAVEGGVEVVMAETVAAEGGMAAAVTNSPRLVFPTCPGTPRSLKTVGSLNRRVLQ
jgi:hypothetical protein